MNCALSAPAQRKAAETPTPQAGRGQRFGPVMRRLSSVTRPALPARRDAVIALQWPSGLIVELNRRRPLSPRRECCGQVGQAC